MLVDANLLLYAADSTSPFHQRASTWLESVLNGAPYTQPTPTSPASPN